MAPLAWCTRLCLRLPRMSTSFIVVCWELNSVRFFETNLSPLNRSLGVVLVENGVSQSCYLHLIQHYLLFYTVSVSICFFFSFLRSCRGRVRFVCLSYFRTFLLLFSALFLVINTFFYCTFSLSVIRFVSFTLEYLFCTPFHFFSCCFQIFLSQSGVVFERLECIRVCMHKNGNGSYSLNCDIYVIKSTSLDALVFLPISRFSGR